MALVPTRIKRSRPQRKVIRRALIDFPPPTPQSTPCRLWQGTLSGRYGRKWIQSEQGHQYMHRWVWERVHGPIPDGMCVLHRCDQPLCFRYEHLFLGTHQDNMKDMVRKRRNRPRGFTPRDCR